MAASFPTIRPGHGVVWDDIYVGQYADNIDNLNTRVTALDPLATRVGCRLRRVANQSVNTGAATAISWDTEDQDTHGFIAVTATTVTIPTGLGGLYAITFRATGATTTGRAFGEIAITSGLTGLSTDFRQKIDTAEDRAVCNYTGPLLAGDSFVCNVFHSEAAALNFTALLTCYRFGF